MNSVQSRYEIAKADLEEVAKEVEIAKKERKAAIKKEEQILARAGLLQAIADHLEEEMNNLKNTKKN